MHSWASQWFGTPWGRLGMAIAIAAIGWGIHAAVFFVVRRGPLIGRWIPARIQLASFFTPSFLIVLYAVLGWVALPFFGFSERTELRVQHFLSIAFVIGADWFLLRVLYLFRDAVYEHFSVSVEDNLSQRRVRTQIQYVVQIASVLLIVLGIAGVLLTFPGARRIGASLIASAGLASVIIGFAAQKSLGNFVAGFQIAFTQPIRIDDVVIVENEWGRVEEITLTYVVVRLWDLRRLVVPITYFVEKPFQNWTRISADLLGTVEIYADFSVPVATVRQELKKIVENDSLWNRKVCLLQVTAATERTIQLRALVSASDASRLFDLRCNVREALIDFIRTQYPGSLPKTRTADPGLADEPFASSAFTKIGNIDES